MERADLPSGQAGLPAEIQFELDSAAAAQKEGNHGKARVCARRAVGKAFVMTEYYTQLIRPVSANESLKLISDNNGLAPDVRDAARRLSTSVAEAETAQVSKEPVMDALVIIRALLRE